MTFLVTGCGRSGTAWAAALFTQLGHPCTHEGQFSLATEGPLRGGESSWLAIPHLASLGPSVSLLRILRDPYKVVQSIVARGFLAETTGPYEKYALKHMPAIDYRDHLGRAIRYVALWDLPISFHMHFKLHCGGPAEELRSNVWWATGVEPSVEQVRAALAKIGTQTNTNLPGLSLRAPSREDIDAHPDGSLIKRRAERYGYI